MDVGGTNGTTRVIADPGIDNSGNGYLNINGVDGVTSGSYRALGVYIGSDERIKFNYSGSAIFQGTVTANGSVLTRASGDLDVGDRLEKADAALQTLKVAAAASTDFASLKSAIATALANI
jgi:hypothetical protein